MPLRIYFLNVGHGDCTIIQFPTDRIMMVDINNSKSLPGSVVDALASWHGQSPIELSRTTSSTPRGFQSWEDYYESLLVDPYDFYVGNFSGRSIFRFIQTHPDMDHMTGLWNFFYSKKVPIQNFWDTDHSKTFTEEDFEHSPYEWVDWLAYECLRNGIGPDDTTHQVIRNNSGDTGQYWTDDNITVLAPHPEVTHECEANGTSNNLSYVLKLTYAGRTVILPGDAESSSWEKILQEYGADELSCDILKASHHGRESGYHEEAVEAMGPTAVVCSVGKKPSTDASDEYASHGASVLSTRFNGTITVTIWEDGDIWVDGSATGRLLTVE